MRTKLLRKLRARYRWVFNPSPYSDVLITRSNNGVQHVPKADGKSQIRKMVLTMIDESFGPRKCRRWEKRNIKRWWKRQSKIAVRKIMEYARVTITS